jgi:hypothetical protein
LARGPQYVRARRAARQAGDDHVHVLYIDGAWQIAVDRGFRAARQIAEENLAAVAHLLEQARVPFFVRDAASAGPITVGVDAAHRIQALAALGRATPEQYLYACAERDCRPFALWHAPRLFRVDRVLVYRNHRVSDDYVIGASHACAIEFWQRTGANLRAPAGAPPGRLVPEEVASVEVMVGGRPYPTLSTFADHRGLTEASFPIDVVYTWVDDADPQWRERLARAQATIGGPPLHAQAANPSRYRNRDELRYSLRSLAMYADFVRRVFIVTDGQVPDWLDVDHPAVTIVDHTEILDPELLPTFNSHAIEARLHHIEGLAEHYLYLNDDFLFCRTVPSDMFFLSNGLSMFFPSTALIGLGEPDRIARSVDAAAQNSRDLVLRHFGRMTHQKMKHAPYPQRRSVLLEAEEVFAEEFKQTTSNQIRSPTDIPVASAFFHYYAYLTGRAVPGSIAARYVELSADDFDRRLRDLEGRRNADTLCINDAVTQSTPAVARREERLQDFLDTYWPVKSEFEL